MANVCCLYTEKFALEVAYREARPPFWDALISRYRHPMTNADIEMLLFKRNSLTGIIWPHTPTGSMRVKQKKFSSEIQTQYQISPPGQCCPIAWPLLSGYWNNCQSLCWIYYGKYKIYFVLFSTPTWHSRKTRIRSSCVVTLQWRHNERDGVSNHQHHDCLLNRLFRRTSKKTSKLRVTGLCVGNSPVTGEFPTQMASNVENVSIWWRHHEYRGCWCSSRWATRWGHGISIHVIDKSSRNILMSATKGLNQALLASGLLWLNIKPF